jgi:uncharacterized protein Yka (UPF0111/DUF47 family)
MFNLTNRSKIYVKRFSAEDGSLNGALLSFNGKIKNDLIQRFKEKYTTEGSHIKNGGRISPQSMLALIGSGGGALGLSSAMSGQLFMATANPATLMAIGNGVGSAVMGATGIVAQAPFISVAGALMPVVAPLLAFQAITTIMIMNQFKRIHDRLNHIEKSINRFIQRWEAIFIGEIISASNRIEEIELQFGICNQFTPEMMSRLSLVEDKVNPIFERYKFLYQTQSIEKSAAIEDLKFKENDAYFAIIMSILDLRIDLLRLNLAIQESAGYMKHSANRLIEKVDYYKELWSEIRTNPKHVEAVAEKLRDTIEEMNWWQKDMPGWLLGKREERTETEKKAKSLEKEARELEDELIPELSIAEELEKSLRQSLAPSNPMNLIYWRDEFGEHSYYTNDLELLPISGRS